VATYNRWRFGPSAPSTEPPFALNTSQPRTSRSKLHLAAPDRLIWLVVGVVIFWGVWAFGSELMLNLRLSEQVSSLRSQNARLAASNTETRQALEGASSASSLEELARNQGFTKPGEQLYVIVSPGPGKTPAGGSGPAASTQPAGRSKNGSERDGGLFGMIVRWLSGLLGN
jgi:cell division protein FtsB